MSDTQAPPTSGQPTGDDGNVDIRALREAADQGKTARKEADELRKENLFLRAGVDVESKVGGMLLQTWDGDDVEALKAEWAEINPAASSTNTTPPPPPDPEQERTQQQAAEAQQHREQLGSTGAPPESTATTAHPVDEAFDQFHDVGNRTTRERRLDALGHVVGAFMQGDERMRHDPADWRQKQELHGDD